MSQNSISLLKAFINYSADKGKVLNDNIANINTENYKRKDVNFGAYLDSQMQNELNATEKAHATQGAADPNSADGIVAEGGDLDIEKEMAELAQNTLNFRFASKRIGMYYKNLQEIIRKGG